MPPTGLGGSKSLGMVSVVGQGLTLPVKLYHLSAETGDELSQSNTRIEDRPQGQSP